MAVENYESKQMGEDYRKRPMDDHGKLRIQYFEATLTPAGDANSTIELCELPPGAVRVIPCLSRVNHSAFGAGRTLDIGHAAYASRPPVEPETAEDIDAFADGIDISAAGAGVAFGTATKFDLYSTHGVVVKAQVLGAGVPDNATISGYIMYVYE